MWECEWEQDDEFHDDDGKHIGHQLFPPTICIIVNVMPTIKESGEKEKLARRLEVGSHIYR